MSTDSISGVSLGSHLTGSEKSLRFIPEPKTGLSRSFHSALGLARKAVSAGASIVMGIDPKYEALIQKQMQVQEQMQMVSMRSNIEKSTHDSKMAAIRNIRAA